MSTKKWIRRVAHASVIDPALYHNRARTCQATGLAANRRLNTTFTPVLESPASAGFEWNHGLSASFTFYQTIDFLVWLSFFSVSSFFFCLFVCLLYPARYCFKFISLIVYSTIFFLQNFFDIIGNTIFIQISKILMFQTKNFG